MRNRDAERNSRLYIGSYSKSTESEHSCDGARRFASGEYKASRRSKFNKFLDNARQTSGNPLAGLNLRHSVRLKEPMHLVAVAGQLQKTNLVLSQGLKASAGISMSLPRPRSMVLNAITVAPFSAIHSF